MPIMASQISRREIRANSTPSKISTLIFAVLRLYSRKYSFQYKTNSRSKIKMIFALEFLINRINLRCWFASRSDTGTCTHSKRTPYVKRRINKYLKKESHTRRLFFFDSRERKNRHQLWPRWFLPRREIRALAVFISEATEGGSDWGHHQRSDVLCLYSLALHRCGVAPVFIMAPDLLHKLTTKAARTRM